MDYAEILRVVGQVLLGGLFVVGGIHHFFTLPGITAALVKRGVPAARFVLIVGSIFQTVAGLALMLNLYIVAAATGLIVFTILASIMLLNFWDLEGSAREGARNGFQTNMAVIGGLLIAASLGL